MAQRTGALVFDERTDRYDIRFDLNTYYGIVGQTGDNVITLVSFSAITLSGHILQSNGLSSPNIQPFSLSSIGQ